MVSNRADFLSAAIVVGLGILCLYLAYSIEVFQKVLIGPRPVPMAIAGMIIALGLLQFVVTWATRAKSRKDSDLPVSGKGNGESPGLSKPAVVRMTALIIIGFAYIWLFAAIGYLLATAIAMAALLVIFGTHSAAKVVLMTAIGTAVYYIIFIRLMGIYNPSGWLINPEMIGL
jgi:putative tricarboxylic transport membrane protein